jgi:hypothetical protein
VIAIAVVFRAALVALGALSLFFLLRDAFDIRLSEIFQVVRAAYGGLVLPLAEVAREVLSDLLEFDLPPWTRDALTLFLSTVGSVALYATSERRTSVDNYNRSEGASTTKGTRTETTVRSEIGITFTLKANVAVAGIFALANFLLASLGR